MATSVFATKMCANLSSDHFLISFEFATLIIFEPFPVAARSKARVCGRSVAWIMGSNPAGGDGCFSLVCVICCQVDVSASGWPFFQRSPTDCGASECDREASKTGRPWPTRSRCVVEK
jgi:hypothetical protein